MMAKICKARGCYNVVWAKDFCRSHQYLRTDKKPKAPNLVGKKREAENKLYGPLRKKFLTEHAVCEIDAPGCTKAATEVHHMRGRIGANFLDVKTWKGCCHSCNQYIEKYDEWARNNGHKKSRLNRD